MTVCTRCSNGTRECWCSGLERIQRDRAEEHAQRALALLEEANAAGNALHRIGRALVHAVLANAAATAARGE
jgi:hypothetical protein